MRDARGNGTRSDGRDDGPPDAELVRRVLDGRRDAYRRLVRRYQQRLHGFALGMVGDPDAAADLLQDALVRAYTRLDGCDDPAGFGPWIHRILRDRCREYLDDLTGDRDAREDPAEGVPEIGRPPADPGGAGSRWTLRDALTRLPGAHREAFLLRHLHGYGYREIAEILDAPVSAVRTRVHRSREILRSRAARRNLPRPGEVYANAGRPSDAGSLGPPIR